jgi:hypothetical protein
MEKKMNMIARVLTRKGTALWLGCLFPVTSIPVTGQVLKGSISATVTDPQGAVVAGAQVKAINEKPAGLSVSLRHASAV